jgi:hypothetical protein
VLNICTYFIHISLILEGKEQGGVAVTLQSFNREAIGSSYGRKTDFLE